MKEHNTTVYNENAAAMAQKFDAIGARTADIEKVFSLIPNKTDPVVVEIGCGNGRDGAEIASRTKNYTGIDISDGMIAEAKKRAPDVRFLVADMDTFDFPTNTNAVVSFASMLHSAKEDIRHLLQKAHGSLSADGIFYISLKKGTYEDAGSQRTDEFGARTYWFYTPQLIQELAGDLYETTFVEEQTLRGQDWFTIALRKK